LSIKRQKRVEDQIQRELSDIVHRKVKDPRLTDLTITGVRVSADYMYADIYVYRLGGDPAALQEAMLGIQSASSYIRRELGSRLTIRFVPELRFHLDESIDYGDRIESLLAQIRQEKQDPHEDRTEGGTTDI
jgi:ribosome-binding factor A